MKKFRKQNLSIYFNLQNFLIRFVTKGYIMQVLFNLKRLDDQGPPIEYVTLFVTRVSNGQIGESTWEDPEQEETSSSSKINLRI